MEVPRMDSVFIVQHLHTLPDGKEDVKFIGVFRSRQAASDAVIRAKNLPGFCECPRLVDPESDDDPNGFYIDEYVLDTDNWREGFVTD